MAAKEDSEDEFFENLQESLLVTYNKSKVLGTESTPVILGGNNIPQSQRNSLFQRLREDCQSEVASLSLTDFNPIFNILARGTKKDAEVEVTMKQELTKAFAVKLAVILSVVEYIM
jgi:hypothetical protein